jgi:NitT/TauT family transport system permease protein
MNGEKLINKSLAQPGAKAGKTLRIPPALYGLSLFILALILWGVASGLIPERHRYLFPSPWVSGHALLDSLPDLLRSTWSSALILVPGYLGAVALGTVWGVVVGTSEPLRKIFVPFARVVAPVPPTVYIPYAIALLPTFRASAIFIVLAAAFWPIFMNAAAGALAVPERHRDNARVLGFGRLEYLRRVAFPAALPFIFNGMGVGLGMSFIMLTVAELFGASHGLGRFVQYYADFADYPRMVAGILYTGLVTFLSMTALGRLERRLVFWPH